MAADNSSNPQDGGLLVTFLDSDEGRRRLVEASPLRSAAVDGFRKKLRGMSCGMASVSLVMRARTGDHAAFAEERLYDRLADIKPLSELDRSGMTAEEVAACLLRLGAVSATVRRPGSVEELRQLALSALSGDSSAAVANFYLPALGFAAPFGHLSPLAAYHPGTDSLLVMDNDPRPNDPFWVPVPVLFRAMSDYTDSETGLTRGLVMVEF